MVSLNSIEKVYKQRNWWDLLWNLLFAKYVTYYIAKFTKFTPNQITAISFIFAIFAGIAFYFHYFILGAVLYQLSYIFDIVDGALARVKKIASPFGAFFDVFTDWLKAPTLIVILLFAMQETTGLILILLLLMWNCCANKYNDMLFYTTKKSISSSDAVSRSKIGQYFEYMKQKHIIPLPGIVEFEALILFLYPIFQNIIFLYLSIVLLLFNFILKIYVIVKKLK